MYKNYEEDTICAISTAIGEGGIGIIRISGNKSVSIGQSLFSGFFETREIQPRHIYYGKILDPVTKEEIDEALGFVMFGPNSYTREDVVEIQCHGGPVPLRKILETIIREGARLAEPGEFTKRAFLQGRLDLTQAESVMDIIRAKTDGSLRLAMHQLSGGLAERIRILRLDILGVIAQLEAIIDFPEEDIESLSTDDLLFQIEKVQSEVEKLLKTAETGKILREGLSTVIIGRPNVGKSSLLNTLLREERAIVTDIPGTTRDLIEEYINVRGIPLKIIDTAGIRHTDDVVEKIGVKRARELAAEAELILLMLDLSQPFTQEDRKLLDEVDREKVIVILNKTDLSPLWDEKILEDIVSQKNILRISAQKGMGISELEVLIEAMVMKGTSIQRESVVVSNTRHKMLLQAVMERLQGAKSAVLGTMPVECYVVDLRGAWELLGEITGEAVVDDIIDQIFSRFCIGK